MNVRKRVIHRVKNEKFSLPSWPVLAVSADNNSLFSIAGLRRMQFQFQNIRFALESETHDEKMGQWACMSH